MQYSLIDLIHADHVLLNVSAESAAQVLELLNAAMQKTGHTGAGYAQDALEREQTFPTGLPTEPIAVAIPHADPTHVNQSAVGIATLQQPVEFGLMGSDGSQKVQAEAVFLLAIKEQEKQVQMLQQLIAVIQSGDLLAELVQAHNSADMIALIRAAVPD